MNTSIQLKKIIKAQGDTLKQEDKTEKQPEKSNKMAISTYLPIITLNVNGLNAPIKGHRVADWIKNNPSICCL